MSGRWHVHLSPAAAAALRNVSKAAAGTVAEALDELSNRGPAAAEIETETARGPEWRGAIAAGDYLVTVAGRRDDARILVVSIDAADDSRAHRAVDVLPLELSTRRRLGGWLEGLGLDLRYTLRGLRRAPLFAVVTGTLAIGFGGATAILDLVNTVYRSALPFEDGERLVRLRNGNTSPGGVVRRYNLTPSDFDFLRRNNRSFSEVVAMAGRNLSLVGDGPAERVSAIGVSPSWARTLGIRPFLGRAFTPAEEEAGSDAGVGLISHALWQSRYGGDPAAVGSLLRYDGGAITVIGVLSPNFNYPYDAALWTPWTFQTTNTTASSLNVVARLSDGASLASARSDAERLHHDRQAANLHGTASAFDVATVRSDFIRDDGRTIQALSASVLFLSLLTCVNVGNLLVARFSTRRAELGVRAALGGRRNQQIRQMLLESLLLFAVGVAGGMVVGNWLRGLLGMTVPDTFRTELGFVGTGVGSGVATLTLGLGCLLGLGVGVAAALRAAHADPMSQLRQGGRSSVGRAERRTFDFLVAAQLSLSLVLLVGASLLIARFRDLSGAHPGYELGGVTTMRLTIEQERYGQAEPRHQLVRTLEERLAAVPGVESVGITSVNPLCCGDWGAPIEIEGRPVAPDEPATLVAHSYVTPGYFRTMKIPIARGAGYDATDRPNVPLTVVIDEPFAQMAWPGEDPLGKRVRLARAGQAWRTVVGVVPATVHEAEMRASWFLPYYQDPTGASTEHLHVMLRLGSQVSSETLRDVVRQIDPALAVYGTTTMEALQRERTSQDRLGAIVSGVFAALGLVLAGFGLYGLLSYSLELRRAEMGLRITLGASRRAIVTLIMGQAARRLIVGALVGLPLALIANQMLRGSIEGLRWVPWSTLLGLAGLMAVVTAAAAAAPALRATRVDPIQSLRE